MRIFEIEDQGNPEELLQFIKENCGPWLSQTNNGAHKVYRGVNYSTIHQHGKKLDRGNYLADEVFTIEIRTNRGPQGRKLYREIYNKVLTELDAVATRENSEPVTSNREQSEQFGVPYVFMPIGNFSYTWSEEIIDWGMFDLVDPDDFEEFREANLAKEWEESMAEYIKPTIRFDDLLGAIRSGHEISIKASSGLYIDTFVYKELLYH